MIEGVVDINKIMNTQHQQLKNLTVGEQASSFNQAEGEQSSQLFENEEEDQEEKKFDSLIDGSLAITQELLEDLKPDDYLHHIISKIFSLQRGYESELSELRHKIKM